MSQAEGPESQVGGSVGDGAKAVLNSVDRLMHKRLTKVKLRGKERERDKRERRERGGREGERGEGGREGGGGRVRQRAEGQEK